MHPTDGLIAEYPFRGNAADTSGHNRHAMVHGATLCADRFGNHNSAYLFDGDDYITVTPPPPLNRDALSVSMWMRYDEPKFSGWNNCIICQNNGNDRDQAPRVFQLSTDNHHLVWHRMIGARNRRGVLDRSRYYWHDLKALAERCPID